MSYSATQMTSAVNALVAAIHGLHPDVAKAWATAEQGVNYNILGVTYIDADGHQKLYKYLSWSQGAEAAASLIFHSSYYVGIVKSLSGSSQQQAAAIIASPWNHPYYSAGNGAAALRQIAQGPANPSTHLYTLVFRGKTPVYNTSVASIPVLTPIYSMTAIAEQHLIGGRWWYKITNAPLKRYIGKWVFANGHFTARPRYR